MLRQLTHLVVTVLLVAPSPGVAQEERSPATRAISGYQGGFFIRSDDDRFLLEILGVAQLRLDYKTLEEPRSGAREETLAFQVRRGRIVLQGHAFTERLSWKLQVALDQGSLDLRDLYLDYALIPEVLRLRAGQWKRPFSRQFLASGTQQELVERAITHNRFATGRDLGIALHNGTPRSGWEWAAGVFNGTGDAARLEGTVEVDLATGEGVITGGELTNIPDMLHPMVVARVAFNDAIAGYSEGDLEGGSLSLCRWRQHAHGF